VSRIYSKDITTYYFAYYNCTMGYSSFISWWCTESKSKPFKENKTSWIGPVIQFNLSFL